jgi:ADP-ribose pyrophosphatase YjhB (NUDIX family)
LRGKFLTTNLSLAGTGGKFDESDVTIERTAARECAEECGLTPTKLNKVGVIKFTYEGKSAWDNECHIYTANFGDCEGEVMETEEMHPQWFPVAEIPYKSMWDDDEIWCVFAVSAPCEASV